jgi:hypothetical protein
MFEHAADYPDAASLLKEIEARFQRLQKENATSLHSISQAQAEITKRLDSMEQQGVASDDIAKLKKEVNYLTIATREMQKEKEISAREEADDKLLIGGFGFSKEQNGVTTKHMLTPEDREYTIGSLSEAAGLNYCPMLDHYTKKGHSQKLWDKSVAQFKSKWDAQKFLYHWRSNCRFTWHLSSVNEQGMITGAWQQYSDQAKITVDVYRTKTELEDNAVLTTCYKILRKRLEDPKCHTPELGKGGKGGARTCLLRQHNKEMQIVTTRYARGVKSFDKMVQVVFRPDFRPPQVHIFSDGQELDYFVTANWDEEFSKIYALPNQQATRTLREAEDARNEGKAISKGKGKLQQGKGPQPVQQPQPQNKGKGKTKDSQVTRVLEGKFCKYEIVFFDMQMCDPDNYDVKREIPGYSTH